MAKVYNVREIMGQLDRVLAEEMQRLGMAVLTNLVIGTPVGNPDLWQRAGAPPGYAGGHARRNWFVGFDVAYGAEIGSPGEGLGEAGSAQEAISRGQAELEGYRNVGPRVILSNDVPYIGRLDEGWSTQAPRGIVDEAVQTALATLPKGRAELP